MVRHWPCVCQAFAPWMILEFDQLRDILEANFTCRARVRLRVRLSKAEMKERKNGS